MVPKHQEIGDNEMRNVKGSSAAHENTMPVAEMCPAHVASHAAIKGR